MAGSDRTLIYLHGFMGSSQSLKARQTREWMQQHYPGLELKIPDLPYAPNQVVSLVEELLSGASEPRLMGSSMGGFYANFFAEKLGARAVMINPAVYPHRLLRPYLGIQRSPYTGQQFEFREEYLQQLHDLLVPQMARPELRMVLLQTGDETLDYREAQTYYAGAQCIIEPGGDHSFVDFDRHLPSIAEFLLQ